MTQIVGIHPKTGICEICGGHTLLAHQCKATGLTFGKCCVPAIKIAESALDVAVENDGLCHPKP